MSNEFRIHVSINHYLYKHCVKLFFLNYFIEQEERMNRRAKNEQEKKE